MALQPSLLASRSRSGTLMERRFLVLFLPYWATDYLKRRDPALQAPLALHERIKGGLRLAALDAECMRLGLRHGQNLADARALVPHLNVPELDRPLLEAGFADLADWHSNASPLVSVLTDQAPYGDLVLDITGVSHLFGGEEAMLGSMLSRLRALGYSVAGAVASTIGAAWAVSHFARSQVVTDAVLDGLLDSLPIAALRLDQSQIASLIQMGLTTIGQLRSRPRKPLQARFGLSLLTRIDQAYGQIEERMTPRLPPVDQVVERRFADPIALMDDVLAATQDLAVKLCCQLEQAGLGGQSFHLFLYRVDHKVMVLSLNAARATRDPAHIANLFRHRAERLGGDYDAGFGIDMVRLAASSLDPLDAVQAGAFAVQTGAADLDCLLDRLGSRLGAEAVLRTQLVASHIPERAARLVPAVAAVHEPITPPPRMRPLRLLPVPEPVAINAEVPDGLPASMIWRRMPYRLVKAAGPERIGAEWWRGGERLQLVKPCPPERDQTPPYVPDLPVFDAAAGTRDYYMVEDADGRRFWIFRQGLYGGSVHPAWYLHGLFA